MLSSTGLNLVYSSILLKRKQPGPPCLMLMLSLSGGWSACVWVRVGQTVMSRCAVICPIDDVAVVLLQEQFESARTLWSCCSALQGYEVGCVGLAANVLSLPRAASTPVWAHGDLHIVTANSSNTGQGTSACSLVLSLLLQTLFLSTKLLLQLCSCCCCCRLCCSTGVQQY